MVNNFVDAQGDLIFFNYSHPPTQTSVDAFTDTVAENGETIAEAQAEGFITNSGLSELFTISSGVSSGNSYEGSAASNSELVASFSVKAGENFSFDFSGDFLLEAKEIENPDVEYNDAQLNAGFLLLDTSDSNHVQVLDYGNWTADLVTSQQMGDLDAELSDNLILHDNVVTNDIDGNNEIDFVSSTTFGSYENTFTNDTNLTLIKTSQTAIQWLGDTSVGNLDSNFIEGRIWDEEWIGTPENDQYYGSLGNDRLLSGHGDDILMAGDGDDWVDGGYGDDQLIGGEGDDSLRGSHGDDLLQGNFGNDTLEAGHGDDLLQGSLGNDLVDGGHGDDLLQGGAGDDTLTGGFGADQFLYETVEAFQSDQVGVDLITDFLVDTDTIVLSQRTFTTLTNTVNRFIEENQFAVVDDNNLADVSEAFITYSIDTGDLFYNQNGAEEGWGEGGHFATLENSPTLNATGIIVI
ncbi:MAG: calcium-binding protein [Halothece sp. Uz-M2-17]|nr:calcium-binding protein [Halothece sp. Uz-M2-17]